MTASLIDNQSKSRLEMPEGGHTIFADYRIVGDRLFIDHVETPVPLRGSGAAGRLMELVVEHAAETNLRIVPICGYAVAWLKRNGGCQ